jgi:hypothetical protein
MRATVANIPFLACNVFGAGLAMTFASAVGVQTGKVAPPPDPTIGDTLVYRITDLWSGANNNRFSLQLSEKRAGRFVYRRTGLESGRVADAFFSKRLGACISATTCVDVYNFPMAVGGRQSVDINYSSTYEIDQECEVEAIESVTVPAGTFEAFRVYCVGRWISLAVRDAPFRGRVTDTYWYAPALNASVKHLFRHYQTKGGLDTQDLTELIEFVPGDGSLAEAKGGGADFTSGVSKTQPSGSSIVNDALAAAQAMPAEFVAGTTRFAGRFSRDRGNTGYSGMGRITWANGDSYDGTLVMGLRQGKGAFTWANGQRYEGDWVADRPEGQGSMRFVNGDQYQGSLLAGTPTGRGTMSYAFGDRYVGELVEGLPSGHGKYTWASGQTLDGDWIRGEGQGPGVLEFPNGNRYEGELAHGLPNGSGRLSFVTGDSYSGNLKDGAPDGEGTYVWKDGNRYSGEWKDGKKEGHGVMSWSSGDRFEGTFQKDERLEGEFVRAAK